MFSRTLILFLFILAFSISVSSQEKKVEGIVKDESNPIALLKLYLVNEDSSDTVSSQTNFDGEFIFDSLEVGFYTLYTENTSFYNNTSLKIDLIHFKKHECEITLKKCNLDYHIKPCPIDQEIKNVIRVFPQLNVHYQFKNKKKEKTYYKKIQKQGYQTAEHEGQIVLIRIITKKENMKLHSFDPCHNGLFCTKHKLAFN